MVRIFKATYAISQLEGNARRDFPLVRGFARMCADCFAKAFLKPRKATQVEAVRQPIQIGHDVNWRSFHDFQLRFDAELPADQFRNPAYR